VNSVCLLVVASRVVAEEPLIVGANRDEILERPSTAVTVLDEGPPRVLGGRDELSGGTWLAVNEHGVCAGLTNQPLGDGKDASKRSRGELPLELARHATASDAVTALLSAFRPVDYNGSWLLVGDREDLFFVDFTGSDDIGTAIALPPGTYVLENRALGETSPKVDLVRAALGTTTDGNDLVDDVLRILADHRIPDGDERPNAASCVHLEGYGTRSSCIVRVAAGDALPRLWVADGPPCTTAYDEVSQMWALPSGSRPGQSRTSGL
jgi:uncharacterized protein with NRDE domain